MAAPVSPEASSYWPIQYVVEPPPLKVSLPKPVETDSPQLRRFENGIDVVPESPDIRSNIFAEVAANIKSPFFALGPGVLESAGQVIGKAIPVDAIVVKRTIDAIQISRLSVYGSDRDTDAINSFREQLKLNRQFRRNLGSAIGSVLGGESLRPLDPNSQPILIEYISDPSAGSLQQSAILLDVA